MEEHLLLHPQLMQLRKQPLRLAEGVAEKEGGAIRRLAPPPVHLLGHRLRCRPPVDGEAEGGFADEHIRLHGGERGTAGIGIAFVITADQPAFPAGLDQDLGRAQHMAGGMEGNPGVPDLQGCAVGKGRQGDASPKPQPQHPLPWGTGPVGPTARAGMVGMGMGEQCPGHGPPGSIQARAGTQ